MDLLFPKLHWKNRYIHTIDEIKYICDHSNSITLNKDKMLKNSESRLDHIQIKVHSCMTIEEKNLDFGCMFWNKKSIPKWTYILSSYHYENELNNIFKASDIECVCCKEKMTENVKYERRDPQSSNKFILLKLDDEYERSEVVCTICFLTLYEIDPRGIYWQRFNSLDEEPRGGLELTNKLINLIDFNNTKRILGH